MDVQKFKIAAIPGDGIGKEVIPAALTVLAELQRVERRFELNIETLPWGSDYFRATGRMLPENGLAILRGYDAILLGAVGDPQLPDHVTLWELRLLICQRFDQYANVRPTCILPGLTSPLRDIAPDDLDWIIVRENSEGEYAGHGGRAHRGLPEEVATETAVFTRTGIERIMRFAFSLAQSRPRRQLTVVTKSNAQRYGMVLWDEIAAEVARNYPGVTVDKMLVDAVTTRMVGKPRTLDVLVASNLHADILSDLAAALAGSLGVAPSANLNPERRFPSMFEPVHGSAFDIMGKGIANPIGSIWSAALMLDHLGARDEAARLLNAIKASTRARRSLTRDLGGEASTSESTEAICAALRAS